MKGLLIKDFINLKQQMKFVASSYLLYLTLALIFKNSSMFIGSFLIYTVILPLTTFHYDASTGWNRYALTMPVSRNDLVLSKYLLYLLINLLLTIFNIIGMLCIGHRLTDVLSQTLIVACAAWIHISLAFPLLFHFDIEKARLAISVLMMIPVMLFISVGAYLSLGSLPVPKNAIYLAPLLTIVMVAASIALSCRLMKRKEFSSC